MRSNRFENPRLESVRRPWAKTRRLSVVATLVLLVPWNQPLLGADEHWAFQPVVRPQLPTVRDEAWPSNPIDAFVLAQLEREGIRPSPAADRATLIRRLHLDLTGLAPSVSEVESFVNDRGPNATQRLVNRPGRLAALCPESLCPSR